MWRFHLLSLPDGQWIDRDLKLADAEVVRALTAPSGISGVLPVEISHLKNPDGSPVIRQWGVGIVAEYDGQKPIFGIVDHVNAEGQRLTIEAGGFTMYPNGQPWLGPDYAGIQVDPLDLVRKIWAHLQSYPDGNLGVTVDPLRSPVRVGEEEREVEFETGSGEQVEFSTGPFRLAWWDTDDLGKVLADLFADTPAEYREHSDWDGENLVHRLELGHPTLGVRRPELRFEVGVNVKVVPSSEETEYASEVLMLGAGEGRTKIRAQAVAKQGRLRRVHVTTDAALKSKKAAAAAARPVLASLAGRAGVQELIVTDHPAARYGTYQPGDEIQILGDLGWVQSGMWVRITEITADVDAGTFRLQVVTV